MLTQTAWAFTRLSGNGVWRYLKNISEVISPRFCLSIPYFLWADTNTNHKHIKIRYNEENYNNGVPFRSGIGRNDDIYIMWK